MESKLQTLGQLRSKFALKKIMEYMENNKIDKETRNFVVGAPTVILQNGLAQALAFWASKVKAENNNKIDRYEFVLRAITGWIKTEDDGDYKQLIKDISEKFSQKEYLIAQKEAISMLEWMKRYANAFWEVDSKD